jgi:Na+/H+ antiporter NhaD/arsenite permease-like protein
VRRNRLLPIVALAGLAAPLAAGDGAEWSVAGVRAEFAIFGLTLVGIAVAHRFAPWIALAGLAATLAFKLAVPGFSLLAHLGQEWTTVANLLLLLMGFAMLSAHVERSRLPEALPRVLPGGWAGAFCLLAAIFVLSAFLDNIAAALIGATIADVVFARRVHLGYLAAIVAAANAGGAGSVIGDTTTTMMWIDGVDPLTVAPAAVGAVVALAFFGSVAAWQQQAHQPIVADPAADRPPIDRARLAVVAATLVAAVAVNLGVNLWFPHLGEAFPWIGAAVWAALLACAPWRAPAWRELPQAALGSVFLLALVLMASLMPVGDLPAPRPGNVLALGFVSAVFDNIPLTKLALVQGGYDWAYLAYAVGFGGSLLWFGSSAGVAIAGRHPQARSVARWLMHGWHVIPAYVLGFLVLHSMLRWRADDPGWRDRSRDTDPSHAVDSLHPLQPPVSDVRAE